MAKVYTKKQLITNIAKQTGIPKSKITYIFEVATKIEKKQLKAGYKVRTPNGQIQLIIRKSRKGIHPQTGEKITIPACKKPKFTFSKDFKKGL